MTMNASQTPTNSPSSQDDVFSQIGAHTEISRFVGSGNVEMLWNIIIQNGSFKESVQADDTRAKLRQHYITKVKQYVETCIRTKTGIALIDLNKSFIADFIHGFRETTHDVQKLDLSDTSPVVASENNIITIEELKSERLNQFDSQYDKMKTDFDQYRATGAPSPDTNFSDNRVVEPLKGQDMEDMMSRTLQSRTEQENASATRNGAETQRARDWLNLNTNNKKADTETLLPHPERNVERKNVSFFAEPMVVVPVSEPVIVSENPVTVVATTDPLITADPVTVSQQTYQPPISPMIALQTRMVAMEARMEEIHTMIMGLTNSNRQTNDVIKQTDELDEESSA